MQHSGVYFSRFSCSATTEWDSESVKSEDVFKQPINPEGEIKMQPSTPQNQGGVRLHEFVSKTVRMPFSEGKSWLFLNLSNFSVPALTNFRGLNSSALLLLCKQDVRSCVHYMWDAADIKVDRLFSGHQAWILRSLWKEDQVWQDFIEMSWLQGGLAPRVSGPLPSAVHPQPGWHPSQNRGGV